MSLKLFNTLTRKKEEFEPLEAGRVRMYTCGPTVYDRPHIGNFRTFLFDDILRRYLEWKGYEIDHVRNVTDVDDNTIKAAMKAGVTLPELTQPFVEAFFEDIERLGLEEAEHYPRATEYVPQMIQLVRKLEALSLAYEADGSVYYNIAKFPDYGRLAQLDRAKIRQGLRVSTDEAYEKQDARDFVLWKGGDRDDEGEVAVWESPWGPGRPGWHLECSVMANTLLGETIDIHTGGVDLIFPHHTNEIAQSEGANGVPAHLPRRPGSSPSGGDLRGVFRGPGRSTGGQRGLGDRRGRRELRDRRGECQAPLLARRSHPDLHNRMSFCAPQHWAETPTRLDSTHAMQSSVSSKLIDSYCLQPLELRPFL